MRDRWQAEQGAVISDVPLPDRTPSVAAATSLMTRFSEERGGRAPVPSPTPPTWWRAPKISARILALSSGITPRTSRVSCKADGFLKQKDERQESIEVSVSPPGVCLNKR